MKNLKSSLQVTLTTCLIVSSTQIFAETVESNVKIFGKDFSTKQELATTKPLDGVVSNTTLKVLGRQMNLMSVKEAYTTQDGKVDKKAAEFYVNGVKIYAQELNAGNGSYSYSGIVPPTSISGDVVNYNIGILNLNVKSRINYEAALAASVSSPAFGMSLADLALNPELDSIEAKAYAQANAAVALEGAASILFARGGVAGSVNLINGYGAASANYSLLNPTHVDLKADAKLQALKADVFGFLDLRSFTGWKRVYKAGIYNSPGKCLATGSESCN